MCKESINDKRPEADDDSRTYDNDDIAYACRHSFVYCIRISSSKLVKITLGS